MRGLSVSLAFAVVLVVCLMLVDGKDVCDYWGVESACKYDGRYKRPDRCTGLGRRYCDRAPEAKVCPEACNEKV